VKSPTTKTKVKKEEESMVANPPNLNVAIQVEHS